jgi:hypothetical protein
MLLDMSADTSTPVIITNWLNAGSVEVQNTGKIMHNWNTATTTNAAGQWLQNGGIFIACTTLTVQAGGEINADGLGYFSSNATNGYGPGGGIYANPCGGGGGYGGAGGRGGVTGATGGVACGASNNPIDPGSGGGGDNSWGLGGGGGYVKILASGTVSVYGVISANGTNGGGGSSQGGGGSGGGIFIRCAGLTGDGTIRANGGNAGTGGSKGGGGGGGRIAIYARNAPFYTSGNLLLTPAPSGGPVGYTNGSSGTVYADFKPRGTMFSSW